MQQHTSLESACMCIHQIKIDYPDGIIKNIFWSAFGVCIYLSFNLLETKRKSTLQRFLILLRPV